MRERNEMIVEDYKNGRDMIAICREYGLKERRVYQILREYGVKGIRKTPRGNEKKALSGTHKKIGMRLYEHYFDLGMTREQAATKLGTSAVLLRNMERGCHNLTLFDIQDIAAFVGTNVGDLVDGS